MKEKLLHHNIEIWGTVISIIVPAERISHEVFVSSCKKAESFYRHIDQQFSTFQSDSEVSLLRAGKMDISDASESVKFVWNACSELKELTLGAFDPWAVPGGFDPSGYVKGWAAEKSLQFFLDEGITNIQINAGGDVVVRGGLDQDTPWTIGVRHPDFIDEMAHSFQLIDGAVASSGTYERGAHVIDPHMGVPAVGSRAATVVGPDAGVADALATALIVDGRDSANWIAHPAFAGYRFWAVDKESEAAWSYTND